MRPHSSIKYSLLTYNTKKHYYVPSTEAGANCLGTKPDRALASSGF